MKARRTQLETIVDVRLLHVKLYFDRVLDSQSKLACDVLYRHHESYMNLRCILLVRDTYPVHFLLHIMCSMGGYARH